MKRSALVLLSTVAIFLGGCAEAIIPSSGSQGYTIIVTPGTATLPGLTTQQFSAKTNDGSKPTLSWTINGIAGGNPTIGTISSTGLYTAPEFPPAPNTIKVSATDTVDTSKTGSSAVTLDNPIPVLTAISPMVISVGPFTLSLTGQYFAPGATVFLGSTALATTVVSSTQLTATGTATNAEVGNVNITVQNPAPGANASKAITAQIKGSGINVQVTPATGTLRAGTQQVFAATVTGTSNTGVTWSINGIAGGNDTVGTIVGNGNYLAPNILPKANTITVTATSVADTTATGNATMTLGNPVPILSTVTPDLVVIGKFSLTLTGSGFMNGSVVNFGSQPLTTTFVSPTELTATGTATIAQVGTVNVSVTNPNPVSATSAPIPVQVVASSNIVVTLTPKSVTIGAGNTTQFQATVTGTSDIQVSWSVNGVPYGNNTVGTVDGNGNYTAPVNIVGLGSVTVTAASVVDPTKSGSATVTLSNPVPTLTAITPGTIGPGAFQLTFYGTGFVATSTATFGGQPLQITYVTDTMITAVGTATSAQAGNVPIMVTNPVPGGGTSNSL
ncbi:MAG: IPT/TIG domain-containing protein, partial [Candidatus Acidiferrum sp.]